MTTAHPAAYVLVLPGGKPRSTAPSRPWQLSNLRMAWLVRALRARLSEQGVVVERVRYRVRGWNEPARDPVRDAAAALERAAQRFGDVPVVLVGHSMGGRVAAHLAAHPNVRAVAALAPWWPDEDAALIPAGRRLLTAHGTRDTWTDPDSSRAQTEQASSRGVDADWQPLEGAGHYLLTQPTWWHRLAADLVAESIGERCHG